MTQEYLGVPVFISKLLDILEAPENTHIVSWAPNNEGFIIHDQHGFQDCVLPKYFKHRNINSFIRQLNMYHFIKIKNLSSSKSHFHNRLFRRYDKQNLTNLKRKPEKKKKHDVLEFRQALSCQPEITQYVQAVRELKKFCLTFQMESSEERLSIEVDTPQSVS